MENVALWGDIATWVTGIATIALFIIGFIQIRNERMARINAEKEIEKSNRREQAEHISSWLAKYTSNKHGEWHWIAVLNQSGQPIYNVIVNLFALSQTGERFANIEPNQVRQACIDVVPPGQGYVAVEAMQFGHPGHSRAGVEIAFQDKSGRSWIRRPNGELIGIETSTIEYYKIDLPANWQPLSNDLPQDEYSLNVTSNRKNKTSKRGIKSKI